MSPTAGNSKPKKVRTFIALYDYNPAEMSPNPDAISTELEFSKGDILEIFGHKDADGFYTGQVGNMLRH